MKCVSDHGPCFVGAAAVVWLDFFSEFELLTEISVEYITPAEDDVQMHHTVEHEANAHLMRCKLKEKFS